MRLIWRLSLLLWAAPAFAGGVGEVRSIATREPVVAPAIAPLIPLDVRDAAVPLLTQGIDVGILPAPLSQINADGAALHGEIHPAAPRAELGGGTLRALEKSPVVQNLVEPRIDPTPASGRLFDGGASRIALLDGPLEAIDSRVGMIDGAASSVFAAYYRFHMDAAGLSKLAMLRQAARQGRDVRLVLDPWGSGIPKPMLKHLIAEGVQIRFYHRPTLSHLAWLWKRSHDKWTIVDGEKAILGDRNMGDHYFGMGKKPWTSREAYVEGRVAAQAQDYGLKLWNSGEVAPPRGLGSVKDAEIAKASAKLDGFDDYFAKRRDRGDFALKPWVARARVVGKAKFSHNLIGKRLGFTGTGLDLLKMIRRAEKTIVIENSYVILPEVFKVELRRAIKRGVRVVLLTNSPKTNNLFWPRTAYEADLPELVKMGIELWEFQGPGTLHAKAMVVDGRRSYLGSFNLDPRSLKLNTETGFIADDADLARDLLGQIRGTQTNSTLIAFQGRLLAARHRVPVLSRLWGLGRRLLLAFLREQV